MSTVEAAPSGLPAVPALFAVQIAPSILAADFSGLCEQLAAVLDAGARVVHVDRGRRAKRKRTRVETNPPNCRCEAEG